jgi:hypothetical protein
MIGLSWALVAVLVVSWLFGYLIVGFTEPWFAGLLVVAALLVIFNLFFAGRTVA